MASITGYTKAALDTKLALLATLASPIFTGTPQLPTGATAITQTAGNNSTKIATTAYADASAAAAAAALVASAPGTLDTLNELATALGDDPNFATTMATNLALKAPLVSPVFTGTPSVPTGTTGVTQSPGDSSTKLATTAFVQGGKVKAITAITAAYTLLLTDAEKVIEATLAAAANITVPPNSAVAFPIGTTIQVSWTGTGKPTMVAGAGVTLNSPGAVFGVAAAWGTITLRKRGTDLWLLSDAVG